jgi:hypothetical protein
MFRANQLRLVREFLERMRTSREVSEEEGERLGEAIVDLYNLQNYPFTALELSASIDEEKVADIFVRINSEGVTLKQADFILTLMSVWWDDGRKDLEAFARLARTPTLGRASPFNHFLQPGPDQMLRVAVALGFKRGQLRHVYSLLRGRDLETGQVSAERREQQFAILKQAQTYTLDLTNWHEFLKVLVRAGFRTGAMLTSDTNVLYSYVLFLIGRRDFKLEPFRLRELMARWFFMSAVTARYSSSPETRLEGDLSQLRGLTNPEQFEQALDRVINDSMTSDYWQITLPNQLESSGAWSPALFAYYASLNLLDARVLFSKLKVSVETMACTGPGAMA